MTLKIMSTNRNPIPWKIYYLFSLRRNYQRLWNCSVNRNGM